MSYATKSKLPFGTCIATPLPKYAKFQNLDNLCLTNEILVFHLLLECFWQGAQLYLHFVVHVFYVCCIAYRNHLIIRNIPSVFSSFHFRIVKSKQIEKEDFHHRPIRRPFVILEFLFFAHCQFGQCANVIYGRSFNGKWPSHYLNWINYHDWKNIFTCLSYICLLSMGIFCEKKGRRKDKCAKKRLRGRHGTGSFFCKN